MSREEDDDDLGERWRVRVRVWERDLAMDPKKERKGCLDKRKMGE